MQSWQRAHHVSHLTTTTGGPHATSPPCDSAGFGPLTCSPPAPRQVASRQKQRAGPTGPLGGALPTVFSSAGSAGVPCAPPARATPAGPGGAGAGGWWCSAGPGGGVAGPLLNQPAGLLGGQWPHRQPRALVERVDPLQLGVLVLVLTVVVVGIEGMDWAVHSCLFLSTLAGPVPQLPGQPGS
jgi:hypothetical protein